MGPDGNHLTAVPAPAPLIRVLAVDDDPLARAALTATLTESIGVDVDCVWGTAAEILTRFEQRRPHAVLIDLMLTAGDMDGIELALTMRDGDPDCVAIIFTSSTGTASAARAWQAGIPGYLTKHWLSRHVRDLGGLIRTMVADGAVFYSVDPRAARGSVTGPGLSEREIEVLRHKADGLPHREIGDRLCISTRTVDAHLAHARDKLGAPTIPDTLRVAKKRGLL